VSTRKGCLNKKRACRRVKGVLTRKGRVDEKRASQREKKTCR
jgi:hypothetical protein